MQWTGLNELREKYLKFFEEKGHLRLPSFSLVPGMATHVSASFFALSAE